jgi:hypothetical protein
MKKFVFLLLSVMMLSLTSCTSNSSNEPTQEVFKWNVTFSYNYVRLSSVPSNYVQKYLGSDAVGLKLGATDINYIDSRFSFKIDGTTKTVDKNIIEYLARDGKYINDKDTVYIQYYKASNTECPYASRTRLYTKEIIPNP